MTLLVSCGTCVVLVWHLAKNQVIEIIQDVALVVLVALKIAQPPLRARIITNF
jgi:hypothetical protein